MPLPDCGQQHADAVLVLSVHVGALGHQIRQHLQVRTFSRYVSQVNSGFSWRGLTRSSPPAVHSQRQSATESGRPEGSSRPGPERIAKSSQKKPAQVTNLIKRERMNRTIPKSIDVFTFDSTNSLTLSRSPFLTAHTRSLMPADFWGRRGVEKSELFNHFFGSSVAELSKAKQRSASEKGSQRAGHQRTSPSAGEGDDRRLLPAPSRDVGARGGGGRVQDSLLHSAGTRQSESWLTLFHVSIPLIVTLFRAAPFLWEVVVLRPSAIVNQ